MRRFHMIVRLFGWLALALVLTGCSYIASLFPDKQKQYQYTTEIPALEVPPDLSISTVTGARWKNPDGSTSGGPRAPAASESADSAEAPGDDSENKITLAQNTEDVPLIELVAPFTDAWNDVGRALGRMKIEISDRNREDGVYYVYYGGPKEKYQDKGVWDDITSLFSGGPEGAQEYRVKLEEHKTAKRVMTDVFLYDSDGQPVRQGPPLDLLKQLHQELQKMAASGKGGGEAAEDEGGSGS
jgi:outer membrane protein assembly factor BamC